MTKLLVCIPLVLFACSSKKEDASSSAPKPSSNGTRFEIAITEQGFTPGDVTVPAGKPITIVFDRKTDQTCAKQVVIDMGDGKKVEKDLPLNTPVEVAATFPKAGKLAYACGMDMMRGTITVQ